MTAQVATGMTSGIGAEALTHPARPGNRILLEARTPDALTVPSGVELLPLDLSSLDSVRTFAYTVRTRLAGRTADALVLNADLNAGATDARTTDD